MKCPNCGKEITDGTRFCIYCGKPVSGSESSETGSGASDQNRSKKKIYAVLLLVLAAVIAVSAFFIFRKPDQEKYQEAMKEAERYLYELDYSKAEEYYLQARRINPKKAEPYAGLYQVYLQEDEPQKAQSILDDARESLEDTQYEKLEESAQEVREDIENTETNYAAEVELGKLDRAPINVGNSGWIIVRDGKFGLIDAKGKTVIDPVKNAFSLYENQNGTSDDRQAYACVYEAYSSEPAVSIHGSDFNENDCMQLDGITVPQGVITLSSSDDLQIQTEEGIKEYTGKSTGKSDEPLFVLSELNGSDSEALADVFDAFKNRQFYIYSQKNKKTYGPYSPEDVPAFGKLRLNSDLFDQIRGLSDEKAGMGRDLQYFSGPFWVSDEDGYTVYSNDESKSRSGLSQVEIISPDAIGVFKNGLFHLLDENLNELYVGQFENGARGIEGLTPVRTDGTWKLVKFENVLQKEKEEKERREKEEKERKEREEKERKEREEQERLEKERQEREAALAADLSSLSGHYAWASGAGAWGCELDVNPDGTFQVNFSDYDRGVTGPDYPNGSHSVSSFSGKFRKVSDQEIQMNDIVLERPGGTSEIIDGMKTDYITNDDIGLSEGSTLTIYPAGTPVSSLPRSENFQVTTVMPAATDGNVLLKPVLSNGQSIFVQQ